MWNWVWIFTITINRNENSGFTWNRVWISKITIKTNENSVFTWNSVWISKITIKTNENSVVTWNWVWISAQQSRQTKFEALSDGSYPSSWLSARRCSQKLEHSAAALFSGLVDCRLCDSLNSESARERRIARSIWKRSRGLEMPPTSEDRRKCLCFYIHTLFGIRRCGGIRLSSNECEWGVVVVVVVRNEIADWLEGLRDIWNCFR